jgi:predicted transcriptional regulator
MEVQLTPELEAKLNEMGTETRRATDELAQDALAGYFESERQGLVEPSQQPL